MFLRGSARSRTENRPKYDPTRAIRSFRIRLGVSESDSTDESAARVAVHQSIMAINGAMNLIIEFFTACTYGYLADSGARRHERSASRTPVTKVE